MARIKYGNWPEPGLECMSPSKVGPDVDVGSSGVGAGPGFLSDKQNAEPTDPTRQQNEGMTWVRLQGGRVLKAGTGSS